MKQSVMVVQVPLQLGQNMKMESPEEGFTLASTAATILPAQSSRLSAGPPQMAPVLILTFVKEQDTEAAEKSEVDFGIV